MKLTQGVILLIIWMTSFQVFSQQNLLERAVTIDFNNLSVIEALDQLMKETDYIINYVPSEVPKTRKISKSYQKRALGSIIKDVWGNDKIILRERGTVISIKDNSQKSKETKKSSLLGSVMDDKGEPIPFATVAINGTTQGVVANENGNFQIKSLDVGTNSLTISSTGYQTQEVTVEVRSEQVTNVFAKLTRSVSKLDEVVITAKSESRRRSVLPIQIASIDTRILKAEATNTIGILTRVSGVRVRQYGGLGSPAEVQLNGLTGNAVRRYYNGIPLELLSGGIQLNNIPVNAIDRIDVYKGVMPIDIGTDALAGGINVVPKEVYSSYLDASYEFGSFNTHVIALNGAKLINNRFFLAFNGFFNYSNNNYKMRNTPVARFETFTNSQGNEQTRIVESIETVERFHDQHTSSFSEVQIGANNLNWSDRIVLSTGFSQRVDEIQHGLRVNTRPAGEVERDNQAFFQNIKFEKTFINKLNLKYFGNYAIVNDSRKDSTRNLYNWSGEIETAEKLSDGAEILDSPSLREGRTFVTVHRLATEYTFLKNYALGVSNFFAFQRITGNDRIAQRVPVENPTIDPNTLPSSLRRNILAAQLSGNWIDKKLETIIFGKYYSYFNRSSDFNQSGATIVFPPVVQADHRFGYGAGVKFSLDDNRFLRIGYESAIRIPTGREVFGDFVGITSNLSLRPEQSDNLNIGLFYRYNFSKNRFASLQVDWFLRDQQDLIRLQIPLNPNAPAKYINQSEVEAQGVEVAFKSRPLERLTVDLSFTFQDVINSEAPNTNNTNNAGEPIPNIPQLFYNLGLRYRFDSPFNSSDQLTLFSYYNHVEEFSLIFEGGVRNDRNFIPTQNQLDSGVSYRLAESGFTFSLQVNNVTNAKLFDNYRIPRPGRNYRMKVRFEI